ncbi:pyrroline-5-carboxylate reductase family protein [Acuticoccus kandeliae]|uniref:pyrroline-5-carboxylate reductase family protein n=1 Tax=Acuticoccus kandeliae TaxID=2073160 RepID=UPI001FE2E768|nr:NAD(P)-binding domain-containing protein [Acuticoccus kandeliae]
MPHDTAALAGRLDATLAILGSGALGGAIARRLLSCAVLPPERLVLANRSGRAEGVPADAGVRVTTDLAAAAAMADAVLFALPPAATAGLRVPAADRLVLSVMAGVSVERLAEITGAARVIRAMSSPAAEIGLAYSPFFAAPARPPPTLPSRAPSSRRSARPKSSRTRRRSTSSPR